MILLAELRDEALLVFAERRDSLEQGRHALLIKDKRAPFTEAEIGKREKRLPNLRALAHGMTALEQRRDEVPGWILTAFEGGENG
jgi:hypothetical protein